MVGGARRVVRLSLGIIVSACGDGSIEPHRDAALSDADARSQAHDAEASVPRADASAYFGAAYAGGEFHLGPVDWEETQFHNACASENKYAQKVRQAAGELLAGVWGGLPKPESFCDTCIEVNTARGKRAVLRVVTYGESTRNSIDVSPAAYALLNSDEYPRNMTWQLTRCAGSGPLMLEFKSGSNPWWTAFWVRNARVPIARVEVMGAHHAYAALSQASDGSWVDDRGVGEGAFSIRVTGIDEQAVTMSLTWSGAGLAGQLIEGSANFP